MTWSRAMTRAGATWGRDVWVTRTAGWVRWASRVPQSLPRSAVMGMGCPRPCHARAGTGPTWGRDVGVLRTAGRVRWAYRVLENRCVAELRFSKTMGTGLCFLTGMSVQNKAAFPYCQWLDYPNLRLQLSLSFLGFVLANLENRAFAVLKQPANSPRKTSRDHRG